MSRLLKEEWIVVHNTHEPIIEQELFDQVQEINQKASKAQKENSGKYDYLPKARNIYGKKFTCADCGAVIKLVRSFSRKKDKVYFTFKCPTYAEHGVRACNAKRIRKADLDESVLTTMKAQFDLFLDMQQTLDCLIAIKKANGAKSGQIEKAQEIRKRIEKKKALFASLYRDLREGLLDEEDYMQTREVLTADIVSLEQQLAEYECTKIQIQEQYDGVKKLRALVNHYYNSKEVTAELVDAMIDTIQMNEDNSLTIKFKYMDVFEEMTTAIKLLRKEVA